MANEIVRESVAGVWTTKVGTGGGAAATPDLAAVLAEGNDANSEGLVDVGTISGTNPNDVVLAIVGAADQLNSFLVIRDSLANDLVAFGTSALIDIGGGYFAVNNDGTIEVDTEGGTITINAADGDIDFATSGTIFLGDSNGPVRLNASALRLGSSGGTVGFYNSNGVAKQTGVAVTAEAIHAALVAMNMIAGP